MPWLAHDVESHVSIAAAAAGSLACDDMNQSPPPTSPVAGFWPTLWDKAGEEVGAVPRRPHQGQDLVGVGLVERRREDAFERHRAVLDERVDQRGGAGAVGRAQVDLDGVGPDHIVRWAPARPEV